MKECPFCTTEVREKAILQTEHFYVIFDRAPVTEGHALIISKEHRLDELELTLDEWVNLRRAIFDTVNHLENKFGAHNYNIGSNIGKAAGQTVFHFHLHVIPRREGDVENPRGGIRNLMKPLEELWPEK